MVDGLRIRRAEVREDSKLTDLVLRSKALWGYDERFMAMCVAELTVQPDAISAGEVWVAEDAERVVGVLELVPKGKSAEIRLIFVEPVTVRSGIGRVLWEHAETRARKRGAERLTLDADPNAVPFYERMGMRIVGESASGSIPGRMLPRMAKTLTAGKATRAA
jgi:GNAT superfamily N-acetyltransferase